MILGVRVWRTADGRYVLDGDPAAAVLAYGPAADVPADVVAQVRPPAADTKQRPAPANKARRPVRRGTDGGARR